MKLYAELIADVLRGTDLEGTDPRHVEAFMRSEHSTLDGLSPGAFDRLARACALAVQACYRAEPGSELHGLPETLAGSVGLAR